MGFLLGLFLYFAYFLNCSTSVKTALLMVLLQFFNRCTDFTTEPEPVPRFPAYRLLSLRCAYRSTAVFKTTRMRSIKNGWPRIIMHPAPKISVKCITITRL